MSATLELQPTGFYSRIAYESEDERMSPSHRVEWSRMEDGLRREWRQLTGKLVAEHAGVRSANAGAEDENMKTTNAPLAFRVDEDELVIWDVDFKPPPAPSTTLKGKVTFTGWAPIPVWREEDLEPDPNALMSASNLLPFVANRPRFVAEVERGGADGSGGVRQPPARRPPPPVRPPKSIQLAVNFYASFPPGLSD